MIPLDLALRVIDSEPELDGDMPDAMWEHLRTASREDMMLAMRVVVIETKRCIRLRLQAAATLRDDIGEQA
jgi:hypothetical protein